MRFSIRSLLACLVVPLLAVLALGEQVESVPGGGVRRSVGGPDGWRYVIAEPVRPAAQIDPLPPDAKEAVDGFDREAAAIRQRAEAEINVHRARLIEKLQAMQDAYTRAAKLDEAVAVRNKIRALKGAIHRALPDPGNLTQYRGQSGKVFHFNVVGTTEGYVWGSGIYTDDSSLATAAVHAGVLRSGERGIVKVTIMPGQSAYAGVTNNGVTSHPYQEFPGSFRVEAAAPARPVVADAPPAPEYLYDYAGKIGQSFTFRLTGSASGSIWGSDVYTLDSHLATAAVHAGVLSSGRTGLVRVTILPGQANYQSSTRNGIASNTWGNWSASFRVEPAGAARGVSFGAQPVEKRLIELEIKGASITVDAPAASK